MEINQDSRNKESFLSHVFSTTDEDKGEMLNIVQYSTLAIIPILLLNKFINRFIPEADPDKSSIELLVEILIQFKFDTLLSFDDLLINIAPAQVPKTV